MCCCCPVPRMVRSSAVLSCPWRMLWVLLRVLAPQELLLMLMMLMLPTLRAPLAQLCLLMLPVLLGVLVL